VCNEALKGIMEIDIEEKNNAQKEIGRN